MGRMVLVIAPLALIVVGCATTSAVNPDRFAGESPAPVVYLPFDGSAHNYGTRSITLTADGAPAYGAGIIGRARSFDGTGTSLFADSTAALKIRDAVTLEAWVNLPRWKNPSPTSAHVETVLALGVAADLLVDFDNGDAYATVMAGGRSTAIRGGSMSFDQWHHLALTYSADGGMIRLYVDGRQVATSPASGTLDMGQLSQMYLGTWYKDNQALNGRIDEVRIYDVALPPEVIAKHAAAS